MPQTILIVDDEKRLVSLVESYLTQEGYRVVTAFNGKDALGVAEKGKTRSGHSGHHDAGDERI